MSTISNDYSFPMQKCQKCVLDRNVHHFKITTLFLYKYAKIASTKHNPTLFLPKQAKIAHTKCPPYQSLHIYCTNKPKLRSPCVHYINHYTFTIQISQNCVHQTQHYTFLTKTSQNCAHQMSTISITTHLLYKQAKIAFTKRPLYQSQHIYYKKKPKLRSPNVHYINHYTFTIQTSQNCVHQINHYTFTMQKRSFGGFWTHTNRFQLCCSSPSDFKSVVVIHQISTLMR